ncbi:hypothetical protein K435DRAFT_805065 [Dendrothele bispora CBS 962.96]|uniref:Uncharacterized protein n=1 Tax=Dendrothele bispora (strain CBS 962.96) TaxID=1314807 RepID=A0A4S8LC99_DENBC|nr:hypothetical protein K435DRAFT_805065 [Dendrothele bispora CBS 962.96]
MERANGVVAELVPLLGSDAEICLRLKNPDIFFDAHANVRSDAFGIRSKLTASLLPLVSHAHRACKSSDPCYFECDSGYILVGHQCACNGCSTLPVPRALRP